MGEPLKDKGTKAIKLVDWVIGLFKEQVEILKKQGLDASLNEEGVKAMEKKGIEMLGNTKVYEDKEIKSAVEWFKEREWTLCPGKCTRCGEWHTYRERRIKEDIEQDEYICFRCVLDEAFQDLIHVPHNKRGKKDV